MILGDIRGERQLELAALGDTVDIASRVEGKCRSLDASILIAAEVIAALETEGGRDGADAFADFGSQQLRGRNAAVHLYGWKHPERERIT
jgi:adenylate cyclase